MILEPTVTVPLREDAHGVIRVGGTRVTLETLLVAWRNGSSAEHIAEQYPALSLTDVYKVIAYVLEHPDDMRAYLEKAEREEREAIKRIDRDFPDNGLRARLLARAKARGLR